MKSHLYCFSANHPTNYVAYLVYVVYIARQWDEQPGSICLAKNGGIPHQSTWDIETMTETVPSRGFPTAGWLICQAFSEKRISYLLCLKMRATPKQLLWRI